MLDKDIQIYMDDVQSGKRVENEYVKLCIDRHLKDLKIGGKRGLWFDEKAANHAIKFFGFIKHYKGEYAKKVFELQPWQKFITANIFGWKNEDGTRRFKTVYVEVPRKNGKTSYAAVKGLYALIADGEKGAEVYVVATKKDQAKICFNDAKQFVLKSSFLKQRIGVHMNNLHILSTASKFEPLGRDSDTLDGLNVHCAIIDEFHAHKTNEIYNVIKSAMGARTQPLKFIITTAGFNRFSPCYGLRKTAIEILKGIKKDDSFFSIIYTLDENDDWQDERNWHKANPNLGISVSLKYLREEFISAINTPSEQVNFKTKHLDLWVDASKVWIDDKRWQRCGNDFNIEKLKGKPCYAGLDLASTRDITALVLNFPDIDGKHIILCFFFVPRLTAIERVRKDNVNYDVWIREGFLIETPGDVCDYNFIYSFITGQTIKGEKTLKQGIAELYDIKMIGFDRWNSSQLVINLTENGIDMSPFGQGFASMSSPTKQLEKIVLSEEINHLNNPVLRWMCGNVEIRRDEADNIKIDKKRSMEKVDGMVALVMAHGEYMTNANENTSSVYENEGIKKI